MNPEHVKVVKAGPEAINNWVKNNPNVVLNLQGANLQGAKLQGAKLQGAKLQGAKLDKSILEYTNPENTNLKEVSSENTQNSNSFVELILTKLEIIKDLHTGQEEIEDLLEEISTSVLTPNDLKNIMLKIFRESQKNGRKSMYMDIFWAVESCEDKT